MQDIDIDRSAQFLIHQHGNRAAIHAAMRATELLECGDFEGVAVWRRVVRAIAELETRDADGPAH